MSIEWRHEPGQNPAWNPHKSPADGMATVRLGVIAANLAAIAERLGRVATEAARSAEANETLAERLTWLCERFEREDREAPAHVCDHGYAARTCDLCLRDRGG